MAIGAVDRALLTAIAVASKLNLEKVRRAYMTMGDIGHIAELALADPNAVEAAEINIFDPVRPMLAEMANSIRDVLEYQKAWHCIRIQVRRCASADPQTG